MNWNRRGIIFFLFLFLPMSVFAQSSVDVLLEGNDEVKLGEEFSVDIAARNIQGSGITTVGGKVFASDSSCFRFVRLEKVNAGDMGAVNNNVIAFFESSADGLTSDTVIARAYFQAGDSTCTAKVQVDDLNYMFTDFSMESSLALAKEISVVNHLESISIVSDVEISSNREIVIDQSSTPLRSLQFDYTTNPSVVTDHVSISWGSSNTDVAVVDASGVVQILKSGVAEIFVQATSLETGEMKRDSIVLRVVSTAAGIDILDNDFSLFWNGNERSRRLNVSVFPSDTTESVVFESSNPSVASVSRDGEVLAKSKGVASVTAKVGAFSDTVVVSVDTKVTDVILDVAEDEVITLIPKQKKILKAQVLPVDCGENVVWSSKNLSVASISSSGEIVAHQSGETVIVARIGDILVERNVRVLAEVSGLVMNVPKQTLNANEKETLQLQVISSGSSMEEGTIEWKSSDPDIVSVSKDGLVTALKVDEGVAKDVTITATWTSLVDSSHQEKVTSLITVVAPIESFEVSEKQLIFQGVNESKQILVTINPSVTTDDATIEWESSDVSIVKVSSEGLVTSVASGTALITAKTKNGLSQEIFVEVKSDEETSVSIESITIRNAKTQMNVGESLALDVLVNPSNATESYKIEYFSSNESIAVIDEAGVIHALKSGVVTFTVRVNGVESKMDVKVVQVVHPKTGLSSVKASMILVAVSLFGLGYSLFKKYQLI